MGAVKDLLTRIHNINKTIKYSRLTCYRYYPGTSAKFPFITPLIAPSNYARSGTSTGGEAVDMRGDREVTLLCGVASPNSDNPIATGQSHAEELIDAVRDIYDVNPYLALSGDDFQSVSDDETFGMIVSMASTLTGDTGLILNEVTGLFEIRFTLNIPLIRSYN